MVVDVRAVSPWCIVLLTVNVQNQMSYFFKKLKQVLIFKILYDLSDTGKCYLP